MTTRPRLRTAGSVRGSTNGRDRAGGRGYRVADLVAELAARDETERPPSDGPTARPAPAAPPVASAPPASAVPSPTGRPAAVPQALAARPRIVEDPSILGLTRVSRSRLGARLFVWFFVLVYAVIVIQLVVTLLQEA